MTNNMDMQEKFTAVVDVIDPHTALEYTKLYPAGAYEIEYVTGAAVKINNEQWLPLSIIAIDTDYNIYILNEYHREYKL